MPSDTPAETETITIPKAWWTSSTIWAGLAQIVLGLVLATVPQFLTLPEDVAGILYSAGLASLTTGVTTVRGRFGATQQIAPLVKRAG